MNRENIVSSVSIKNPKEVITAIFVGFALSSMIITVHGSITV